MTELEEAQGAYDSAVAERRAADKIVNDAARKVIAARNRLDDATRKAAETIPVDRSDRQLTDGGPVTADHREINPASGQQKGYVVLSPAERAKGFVRPYRDAYRHQKCGAITTMSRSIAETYARDPGFYDGTFCSTCRSHFPVGENGQFTWYEMDGREGPKVGT